MARRAFRENVTSDGSCECSMTQDPKVDDHRGHATKPNRFPQTQLTASLHSLANTSQPRLRYIIRYFMRLRHGELPHPRAHNPRNRLARSACFRVHLLGQACEARESTIARSGSSVGFVDCPTVRWGLACLRQSHLHEVIRRHF